MKSFKKPSIDDIREQYNLYFKKYLLSDEGLPINSNYWEESVQLLVTRTSTAIFDNIDVFKEYKRLFNIPICRQIMEINAIKYQELRISLYGNTLTYLDDLKLAKVKGDNCGISIKVYHNSPTYLNSSTLIHELCHKAMTAIFNIWIGNKINDNNEPTPYPELYAAYDHTIRSFLNNVTNNYLKIAPTRILEYYPETLNDNILYGNIISKHLNAANISLPAAIDKFMSLYKENNHYVWESSVITTSTEKAEFIVRYPQAFANDSINKGEQVKETL